MLFVWLKFASVFCGVILMLALLTDLLTLASSMTVGSIYIAIRSPYVLIIPFTLWCLLALAITWPLAGRLHLRPF
jgi:hypothetical protein